MKPEQTLKKTTAYLQNLQKAKKLTLVVGLPKETATSKVYPSGKTVLEIGAIHEFGAIFTHPGGTPYIIGKDGKAKFVSLGRGGAIAGITKPHTITIPQRSFLRVPFAIKKKEIDKLFIRLFREIAETGVDAEKQMEIAGVFLQNISKEAFETRGFGTWEDIKSGTKNAKGSSGVLMDKGILRGSISYEVRK